MDSATVKRSVAHHDRSVFPQGTPDSRDGYPSIATSTFSSTPKPVAGLRHKRSTDDAFANDDTLAGEENIRLLRQRTGSSTSIKSAQTRLKAKATSRVLGSESDTTAHSSSNNNDSTPTCCVEGDTSSTHKSPRATASDHTQNLIRSSAKKHSSTSTRTPLRLLEDKCTPNESVAHQSDSSRAVPSKQNLPAFNIGNVQLLSSSLFSDFLPYDQPYVVIADNDVDIDDSILRWDMDTVPSFPHPLESSEDPMLRRGTASSLSSLPFPSPFSEPLDDDSDSSDEAPFQIPKSPVKIVREDMAIRKAKHRSPKSPQVTRSSLRPFPSVSLSDNVPYIPPPTIILESDVKDPFYPLPLRRLGHSPPERPHPWAEPTPHPHPSSHPFAPPMPSLFTTMNNRYQEPYRLRASDCELSVAFPQTSHYEIWDQDDDSFISCPVILCLIDKGTHTGTGSLLADPDVTLLEITCDDVPIPTSMLRYDIYNEYSIIYGDNKTGTAKDQHRSRPGVKPTRSASAVASGVQASGGGGLKTDIGVRYPPKCSDEIEIDGRWTRIYARPRPRNIGRRFGAPGSGLGNGNGNGNAHPASMSPFLFGNPMGGPTPNLNPLGLPPFLPPPPTSISSSSISFSTSNPFSVSSSSSSSTFLSTPSISPSPSFSNPSPPNQPSRPPSLILTHAEATGQTGYGATARGFYLKVWIPIPLRLFVKRETRLFHVKARAWLNGDEEKRGLGARKSGGGGRAWPDGLLVEGGLPLGSMGYGGTSGFNSFLGDGNGIGHDFSGDEMEVEDEDGLIAAGEMSISHLRSWRCFV